MGKHTNRKSSTSCVIQTTAASPEEVQSVKTERERKWKWNSWRAVTSSSPPTIGFSSLASATPPLPASFIAFLLFSTNSCKIWTKLHKFLGPFRFWLTGEFKGALTFSIQYQYKDGLKPQQGLIFSITTQEVLNLCTQAAICHYLFPIHLLRQSHLSSKRERYFYLEEKIPNAFLKDCFFILSYCSICCLTSSISRLNRTTRVFYSTSPLFKIILAGKRKHWFS